MSEPMDLGLQTPSTSGAGAMESSHNDPDCATTSKNSSNSTPSRRQITRKRTRSTSRCSIQSTRTSPRRKCAKTAAQNLEMNLSSEKFPHIPASIPKFWFAILPLHIQKQILEYLPWKDRVKLEKVCRIWHRLLREAWNDVKKVDIPTSITDKLGIRPIDDQQVCGFLGKCGAHLRRIDFFFLHNHIADHVLYSITHRCHQLRELFLTTDIQGRQMSTLLKRYCNVIAPNLQEFSLSYHNETDHIHNGLRAATREMGYLRAFRFDTFHMPPNVATLFPSSPVMKHYALLLLQPGTADQNRWKYVRPDYLMEFFEYLVDMYPQLEELDISIDTDISVDEQRLFNYLRQLGINRRISRLNLRIRDFVRKIVSVVCKTLKVVFCELHCVDLT